MTHRMHSTTSQLPVQPMNKILTKSLLFAALATGLMSPSLVRAQMAVVDAPHTLVSTNGWAQQASQMATMNAQLKATDTYLQTGFNGNGLIPLLSSINEKMGKSNFSEAQQENNANIAARNRQYDEAMIGMKAGATPTQEQLLRACVAVTERKTNPQGNGAAGGTSDAFRDVRGLPAAIEKAMITPTTPANQIANIFPNRDKNGFCTDQEVKNGFPGCTKVGALAGADIRSSSLTMGATTTPGTPTNGSLNEAQTQAALAYIQATTPLPPTMPDNLDSPAGRVYQTRMNQYVARSAASRDMQASIVASHKAIPPGQGSPSSASWQKMKPAWERTFGPQIPFPTSPSERDMLRLKVYRYYADPDYQVQLAAYSNGRPDIIGDAVSVSKEQANLLALIARLEFQQLQRQEETNILLAQILNNLLDPMTRQGMETLAAGAARKPTAAAQPAAKK